MRWFGKRWLGARALGGRLLPSAGRRAFSAGVATLVTATIVFAPLPSAASSTSAVSASAGASGSRPASLPRQFSIEVGPGGLLVADGTRLAASGELERWAQRALAAARFSGAVVFGDEARDGGIIAEVVERLRRAGFSEVRRAGRAAPQELSALARAGAPPLIGERVTGERVTGERRAPGAGTSSPSGAPAAQHAPNVSLATVGLHVDGLLSREPHRSRLVRVFEREFNAFRRCHDRAERHEQGASFGVDLLIPKAGGRGKVRQTRTRLASKDFRACMQRAFESIRFAPPPSARPEIVSYSVLFKPSAR